MQSKSLISAYNRFLSDMKWATSWQNLFMPYANHKGTDQSEHSRSLIHTVWSAPLLFAA